MQRTEPEAIRDYIAAAELDQTAQIRTRMRSGTRLKPLNERYVIVETRRALFLVELRNRCNQLFNNTRLVADVRRHNNTLSARFDTIRGCAIARIFPIDNAQAAELRHLGDAPGSEAVAGRIGGTSAGI